MKHLTAARLRELLNYDPLTGVFMRLVDVLMPHGGVHFSAGTLAGCITHGYVLITIDGKHYRAHRLAWMWVHGAWPTGGIDHINGVRTDNRLDNLRQASQSLNMQNQRRALSNNKTGFLGVSLHKASGLYRAEIRHTGKDHCLGYFTTPELASAAYLAEKRLHHQGCTI